MKKEPGDNEKDIVLSLQKAISILDVIYGAEEEVSIGSVCTQLLISKTTVYRILNTLEAHHYVERNELTKKYKLGSKLFLLGTKVSNQLEVRQIARPVMEEIRNITGESVHLNVVKGKQRICVEVIDALYGVRAIVHIGQTSPLYAGASSKVLLAYEEDEKIREYLRTTTLERLSAKTITDHNAIWEQLMAVRKNGYSITESERVEWSVSIAVPIYNHASKVIAAMGISFPTLRLNEAKMMEYIQLLKQGAAVISQKLGYSKPVTMDA